MAKNSKSVSHYEVAVKALDYADRATPYKDDGMTDALLANAERIKSWLLANSEFVPEETTTEPTPEFLYFSDEEREDGRFPEQTYWYRYEVATDKVTYRSSSVSDRREIDYPTQFAGRPYAFAEYWGLYPATREEVKSWGL